MIIPATFARAGAVDIMPSTSKGPYRSIKPERIKARDQYKPVIMPVTRADIRQQMRALSIFILMLIDIRFFIQVSWWLLLLLLYFYFITIQINESRISSMVK
jgi:hypothetical protein